jgi:hypothetical protein
MHRGVDHTCNLFCRQVRGGRAPIPCWQPELAAGLHAGACLQLRCAPHQALSGMPTAERRKQVPWSTIPPHAVQHERGDHTHWTLGGHRMWFDLKRLLLSRPALMHCTAPAGSCEHACRHCDLSPTSDTQATVQCYTTKLPTTVVAPWQLLQQLPLLPRPSHPH